jgi:hypothetical protein
MEEIRSYILSFSYPSQLVFYVSFFLILPLIFLFYTQRTPPNPLPLPPIPSPFSKPRIDPPIDRDREAALWHEYFRIAHMISTPRHGFAVNIPLFTAEMWDFTQRHAPALIRHFAEEVGGRFSFHCQT